MLDSLRLKNVGPAPEMKLDLAPRLNLITGDNGLGKSFLLDVAWWALTRTWAREMAIPAPGGKATITYAYTKRSPGLYTKSSNFDPVRERWPSEQGRPPIPGLIIYAQVDGAFSVWDPERNYWKEDAPDRPKSFCFQPREVWEGSEFCEGLIRDWASWQREQSRAFQLLVSTLRTLSPSEDESLEAGDLRKLTASDPKKYPTLRMSYGQDVPVVHASAGMRRIIALAYLLVWAWEEHIAAASVRGDDPTSEVVFLIDEIEAHLHPQWQRRIVPALLNVMRGMTGDHGSKVQLIAATHSPLVLASVEPLFEVDQDKLFVLDIKDHIVSVSEKPWALQGDVINWLVSESFGLEQARSIEAERAIEAAEAWMRNDHAALPDGLATKEAIHAELRRVLAGHDPFWPRWIVSYEKAGDRS